MRVTIETEDGSPDAIREPLLLLCGEFADIEVVQQGRKTNLAGDSTSFLTVVISAATNIALGVLSSYLYDLIKQRGATIKIEGKRLLAQSAKAIEDVLRQADDEDGNDRESREQ